MKTRTTKGTAALPAILLGTVPSTSTDEVYEIKRSQRDGVVYCSCKSWKYDMEGKKALGYARHPAQRSCKHIRYIQNQAHVAPRPQVRVEAPKVEVKVEAPKVEAVTKSVNVSDLRKTAAYAIKKGLGSDKVFALLKDGGLSDLAAWSLLAELDA